MIKQLMQQLELRIFCRSCAGHVRHHFCGNCNSNPDDTPGHYPAQAEIVLDDDMEEDQ